MYGKRGKKGELKSWSQTEKDIYCLYAKSKKLCKWTYFQNRNSHMDLENKQTVNLTGGRMGGKDRLGG